MFQHLPLKTVGFSSRVLSARYDPRKQGEANDLGWNKLIQEADNIERSIRRNIEQGIKELEKQNRISKSMAIGAILNPIGEEVDDESDEIIDGIAQAYI